MSNNFSILLKDGLKPNCLQNNADKFIQIRFISSKYLQMLKVVWHLVVLQLEKKKCLSIMQYVKQKKILRIKLVPRLS